MWAPVAPVDDPQLDGVLSGIGGAQLQGVRRAFFRDVIPVQSQHRRHLAHRNTAEVIRVPAVLVEDSSPHHLGAGVPCRQAHRGGGAALHLEQPVVVEVVAVGERSCSIDGRGIILGAEGYGHRLPLGNGSVVGKYGERSGVLHHQIARTLSGPHCGRAVVGIGHPYAYWINPVIFDSQVLERGPAQADLGARPVIEDPVAVQIPRKSGRPRRCGCQPHPLTFRGQSLIQHRESRFHLQSRIQVLDIATILVDGRSYNGKLTGREIDVRCRNRIASITFNGPVTPVDLPLKDGVVSRVGGNPSIVEHREGERIFLADHRRGSPAQRHHRLRVLDQDRREGFGDLVQVVGNPHAHAVAAVVIQAESRQLAPRQRGLFSRYVSEEAVAVDVPGKARRPPEGVGGGRIELDSRPLRCRVRAAGVRVGGSKHLATLYAREGNGTPAGHTDGSIAGHRSALLHGLSRRVEQQEISGSRGRIFPVDRHARLQLIPRHLEQIIAASCVDRGHTPCARTPHVDPVVVAARNHGQCRAGCGGADFNRIFTGAGRYDRFTAQFEELHAVRTVSAPDDRHIRRSWPDLRDQILIGSRGDFQLFYVAEADDIGGRRRHGADPREGGHPPVVDPRPF